MNKLLNWLKWIDDNLLHVTILIFIITVSLLPKIPLKSIEFTYIKFRIDDLLPAIIGVVFVLQLIRRKAHLNTKFLVVFCLFWLAVFISFFVGSYLQNTIPIEGIGYLHTVRRIEYMFIFFIASSAIVSEKRFKQYLYVYLFTLGAVSLFGLGQRFLRFPSIQSINPAYADGRILYLHVWDRINSTFGGHFDLAAYITFSLPIVIGVYYSIKNKAMKIAVFALFVTSLTALMYTSMRSAFGGYIVSVTVLLLLHKKYKALVVVLLITAVITLKTGVMIKRFQATIQVNDSVVNTQTNAQDIIQKNTVQALPGGGPAINIPFVAPPKTTAESRTKDLLTLKIAARNKAREQLVKQGKVPTDKEVDAAAANISKYLQVQRGFHCDTSCSTRLFSEWPRAIALFQKNILFGGGPSSNTAATDNDILRWLAEQGLVGTGFFVWILYAVCKMAYKAMKLVSTDDKMIYSGFIWGVIALLFNATYVDVFEASKVAYNFWLIAGFYVGAACLIINKSINEKRERNSPNKIPTA